MTIFTLVPMLLLSSLSLLQGCTKGGLSLEAQGRTDFTKHDDQQIKLMEQEVRDHYRDPEAVEFRSNNLNRSSGTAFLCGELNAKNGSGGYVGYTRFFYAQGQHLMTQFDPSDEGYPQAQRVRSAGFDRLYFNYCMGLNAKNRNDDQAHEELGLEQDVRNLYIDPEAVKFRLAKLYSCAPFHCLCGELNAKSGSDHYVGYTRFVYMSGRMFGSDGLLVANAVMPLMTEEDTWKSPGFGAIWKENCSVKS